MPSLNAVQAFVTVPNMEPCGLSSAQIYKVFAEQIAVAKKRPVITLYSCEVSVLLNLMEHTQHIVFPLHTLFLFGGCKIRDLLDSCFSAAGRNDFTSGNVWADAMSNMICNATTE